MILGKEHKALFMLVKHSDTQLYSQPNLYKVIKNYLG